MAGKGASGHQNVTRAGRASRELFIPSTPTSPQVFLHCPQIFLGRFWYCVQSYLASVSAGIYTSPLF